MTKTVTLEYIPRAAFEPFHRRRQRWSCLVAHRRSGKTFALIHDLLIGALETIKHRPQFAFIAPTYAQAKRIAWEYLKDAARPFLKGTPNETELRVDLLNDGRIFLAGSDNADSLRGMYLDGVVLDEYAMQSPIVWTQIIRPALADREGWAVLSGTPKGKNHFFDEYNRARLSPEWYSMLLPASLSGILPMAELNRLRDEMPEDEFLQEMECDFTATTRGAILFREIEAAEREGRVSDTPLLDPHSEIFVASDIGFRDTAAWWFGQRTGDGVAILDYIEDVGMDADDWIGRLKTHRYVPDEVWLPHDANNRTFQTRNTAFETFMRSGVRTRIVPRTSVLDRVNAARVLAKKARFHRSNCAKGLQHLRDWTYEWDANLKVFSKTPLHNAASHGGDAFSYLAQMIGNDFRSDRTRAQQRDPIPVPDGHHYVFSLEQLHEDRELHAPRERF